MKTLITFNGKSLTERKTNKLHFAGVFVILAFLLLSTTSVFAQKTKARKIDKVEMQKRKAEGRIIKG